MPLDPMTIASVASAGSSLLGGLFGSSSASDAAEAQQAAAELAVGEQRRQYDTTRRDLTPWRRTGRQAVDRLGYLLGLGDYTRQDPRVQRAQRAYQDARGEYNALMRAQGGAQGGARPAWEGQADVYGLTPYGPQGDDQTYTLAPIGGGGGGGGGADPAELAAARRRMQRARNALDAARAGVGEAPAEFGSLMRPFGAEDFQTDPGYQFRLGQGQQAIENSAAARGMQLSGATLKGLNRFTQDFASNEYQNAWGRDAAEKGRAYNFLSGTSGQGLGAATNTAAFGQQGANNIADLYTQMGNSQAAGIVGAGNAWQNALGGAGNALSDYAMMKALMRR